VGVGLIARFKPRKGNWRGDERGVGRGERRGMRELCRREREVKGV